MGCGVVVPPGRPEALARAIRSAHDGRYDLDEMGRRGREFVVAEADREVAVARYAAVLHEVLQ
jgi:glycosyltransferase involved in cell wall biosynthesis